MENKINEKLLLLKKTNRKKVIDIKSNPILLEINQVETSLATSEGILTNNDNKIKRLITGN